MHDRLRGALYACLLTSLMGLSARAQSDSPSRFMRWAYQDAGALVQENSLRTPLLLIGAAALVTTGSSLDGPGSSAVRSGYTGQFARYLDATNRVGESAVILPAAALFAASLTTDNTRFQDAAFTSLQSVVYARLFTNTMKFVFGRYRPVEEQGAMRFEPFGGQHRSFPSGHTTVAFALVTPWVMYYPSPLTYSLFAISGGTALARIAKERHWPTDVAAGAAVGVVMGMILSRRHQADRQGAGPSIDFMPPPIDADFTVLRVRW